MSAGPPEQRDRYKGTPQRPWLRVRLVALGGTFHDVDLVADTGSPCAIVVSVGLLNIAKHGVASNIGTNFGTLTGGWLHVAIEVLGWERDVVGYGNDAIVHSVKANHADFEGLVGLPFLRQLDYGGDADSFWVRLATPKP